MTNMFDMSGMLDILNNIKNLINTLQEQKQLELELQTNPIRRLFVKIEILDQDNNVKNEVSGSAIGGSYNIDSTSAIRRTCSITFNLENGYLPNNKDSIFWINKRFKLYIGLAPTYNNDVYWFNKGVYAIKDPSINIAINESTITISGLDKMALHNGDIGGQLENAFITDIKDTDGNIIYVEDAIRALMLDSGENNLLITNTELALPHKIESGIGDTRYEILSKFTELFYNYQIYYDVDGNFIFGEKPAYQSNGEVTNDIDMDFSNSRLNNLLISINREIAYSNVKNKIVVYGGVHDDGYQPKYELIINDATYPDSPYTIERLGEKISDNTPIYRTLVVQDDTYVDDGVAENETDDMETVHKYSISLCKDRAVQEAYLHQQATDIIKIVCVPIYSLDVNTVIKVNDEKSGANGEYVITNISCGLGIGDTMSITANKLW